MGSERSRYRARVPLDVTSRSRGGKIVSMLARAARLTVLLLLTLFAAACARPDTVVHVSAPHEARWEVRDREGTRLCSLPCRVELEEGETVVVIQPKGRTQFVVRQQDLGEGEFSAWIRVRREDTRGTLAGRVIAAALAGAGSVLEEAGDTDYRAAGVFLSGVGAAARAASDAARRKRLELWVEPTSTH